MQFSNKPYRLVSGRSIIILIKFTGLLILTLYFLVLIVALTEGPMVSYQSFLLGIMGLIVIVIMASPIAKSINLIDSPDGVRKLHQGSVPLVGGLVLFISFVYGAFVFGINPFYRYLLLSLIPILIVGTLDGFKYINIPISFRIIAQIVASWMIILLTDVYVRDLGDLFGQGVIHLNKLGIPFTIFAVVGASNAFNMLDGKDGLAGSVSVATIACLLLLLYLNDIFFNWGLILIMSLLVFLAFNLNLFGSKRKIFLGDHGSNALGYSIAWTLIFLSQEENIITPISAIWFVFLPITDALLTIVIRLKSARSLFHGDRQHFHHKLSDLSLSDATILIILVVVSIFTGLIAVGSNYWHWHEYNLTFGYFTVFVSLILLRIVRHTKEQN